MDPSASEQECAEGALSVAVSDDGQCCGITYIKPGLLSKDELIALISVSIEYCFASSYSVFVLTHSVSPL
jgi:hypothetical protein